MITHVKSWATRHRMSVSPRHSIKHKWYKVPSVKFFSSPRGRRSPATRVLSQTLDWDYTLVANLNLKFAYMNDFFNHDNIYNQIIKRTLTLLMNYRYLKDEYEWTMVDIYNYLRKVSYIKIDKTVFDGLVMHKYNKSYEYLVKLCEFIWCELDISDSCGKSEFLDLTKEPQKLNDFITRFVKVFYKQELLEHPK